MKIMFVCLGNICRSAMAEFMMKDALKKSGGYQKSTLSTPPRRAGSQQGNPVYPDALKKTERARCPDVPALFETGQKKTDYDKYDLFLGMDDKKTSRISKKSFSRPTKKKVKKVSGICRAIPRRRRSVLHRQF
ncbi:MAG: hypothetical protein L6V85_00355 [Clostridiales bacterium]|nr:MAG: hypothetical protein L6V85_00355 [Clostridiales bacterium]